MNPALQNCLIEKKMLIRSIDRINSTLQEPRFWEPDTFRVIPYKLVRKVDAKIQQAGDLINQIAELPHDEAAGKLYAARMELEVLNYLIAEEELVNDDK